MSVNYAEKEREFITTLAADTGRDLAGWLAAIDAEALSHRNDIIDWLRHQGFHFGWASWLERIHHNGGRLVYGGIEPRDFGNFPKRTREASRPQTEPRAPAPPSLTLVPAAPPSALPVAREPIVARANDPALDSLLAKAKAYRPLAKFTLGEIETKIPETRVVPRANHVSLSNAAGMEFAVLAVSAKELKLGLALGSHAFDDRLVKAKISGPNLSIDSSISHMIVLTDARQVTMDLIGFVQTAFNRAHG